VKAETDRINIAISQVRVKVNRSRIDQAEWVAGRRSRKQSVVRFFSTKVMTIATKNILDETQELETI
jgi:hypothetical protein